MTKEDYLRLAARFVIHTLLNNKPIDCGSADACNLIELCYEGLGHHDDDPQVPFLKSWDYNSIGRVACF
jgi:hypothetical protein